MSVGAESVAGIERWSADVKCFFVKEKGRANSSTDFKWLLTSVHAGIYFEALTICNEEGKLKEKDWKRKANKRIMRTYK